MVFTLFEGDSLEVGLQDIRFSEGPGTTRPDFSRETGFDLCVVFDLEVDVDADYGSKGRIFVVAHL